MASVAQTGKDIAAVVVEDGIGFDPDSMTGEETCKEARYAGARVISSAELAGARVKTQVDIGFGDAVTPDPVQAVYSVLLADFPAPTLQTYPVSTVIAEKLHAIALLGMTNSRLKDYLDLSVLLERETLDRGVLTQAITATFKRRGMVMTSEVPIGLSDEFANDASRQTLWRAFLKKNQITAVALHEVVAMLRDFLHPAIKQVVDLNKNNSY